MKLLSPEPDGYVTSVEGFYNQRKKSMIERDNCSHLHFSLITAHHIEFSITYNSLTAVL